MRAVWLVCVVALLGLPAAPALAQDEPIAAVSGLFAKVPKTSDVRLAPAILIPAVKPETPKRPAALVPLYASLAAFNALDVHSTLTGLSTGRVREVNPVMKPVVTNQGAFIALKATATAASILLTEKARQKHPKRAVVMMIVTNAVMAAVVANNYRLHER